MSTEPIEPSESNQFTAKDLTELELRVASSYERLKKCPYPVIIIDSLTNLTRPKDLVILDDIVEDFHMKPAPKKKAQWKSDKGKFGFTPKKRY